MTNISNKTAFKKEFLDKLTPYQKTAEELRILVEQNAVVSKITSDAEYKGMNKNFKCLNKEFSLCNKIMNSNIKLLKGSTQTVINEIKADFESMTAEIRAQLNEYKKVMEDYKKTKANALTLISVMSKNPPVQQGTLQEDINQVNEKEVQVYTDTEIINFLDKIIMQNGKLVARCNSYKGVQIYHDSSQPDACSSARVALSQMIKNYNDGNNF